MKNAIIRNIIPAFLALIAFMVLFPAYESISRLIASQSRAIDWFGVQVLTPTVTPGGTLELVYKARINKQCPSDLQGFLVADDGSVPVRFPVVAGGYRPPSEHIEEIKVKVQIPLNSDPGLAPLEAGRFTYKVISTRYCLDGVEQDRSIPPASFTIRKNLGSSTMQGLTSEYVSMVP